jgi:prolyl oligopeptidase
VEEPSWLLRPFASSRAQHPDVLAPGGSSSPRAPNAQAGDAPVLLRVETKAGHGAGKPTAKLIDEVADRYAFLVKTLGVA